MKIIREKKAIILNSKEEEEAYRKRLRYYHTIDAKEQCERYLAEEDITLQIPLNDSDYEWLAEVFEEEYDANVSDNDRWHSVVKNYIDNITE